MSLMISLKNIKRSTRKLHYPTESDLKFSKRKGYAFIGCVCIFVGSVYIYTIRRLKHDDYEEIDPNKYLKNKTLPK